MAAYTHGKHIVGISLISLIVRNLNVCFFLTHVQNQYCKIEKGKAERCGVKDLNPAEGDGLLMWKPGRCSNTGCKCVPVRDVQVRHGNDGTVLAKAPKRYRIFECA